MDLPRRPEAEPPAGDCGRGGVRRLHCVPESRPLSRATADFRGPAARGSRLPGGGRARVRARRRGSAPLALVRKTGSTTPFAARTPRRTGWGSGARCRVLGPQGPPRGDHPVVLGTGPSGPARIRTGSSRGGDLHPPCDEGAKRSSVAGCTPATGSSSRSVRCAVIGKASGPAGSGVAEAGVPSLLRRTALRTGRRERRGGGPACLPAGAPPSNRQLRGTLSLRRPIASLQPGPPLPGVGGRVGRVGSGGRDRHRRTSPGALARGADPRGRDAPGMGQHAARPPDRPPLGSRIGECGRVGCARPRARGPRRLRGLDVRAGSAGLAADRRALRVVPADFRLTDARDAGVVVRFALPRGAFATAVLRELVRER